MPSSQDSSSHSHIRVVPRVDDEGSDMDDSTPTYRSQSLQHPRPAAEQNIPTAERPAAESAAPAKTFADMARCVYPRDTNKASQQSLQNPATGIVKLQPHRKIGQDSWRPAQPSELSVACENASFTPENMERLLHVGSSAPPAFVTTSSQPLQYNRLPSKFEAVPDRALASLTTEPADALPQHLRAQGPNETHTPPGTHPDSTSRCTELFGKLPDQMHLHEELGKFDGQVVFIGHPNRDVSAHQWSSASFQWESIGRYSCSKNKTEGSLASERVNGVDPARDALLHFKRAAEDREKYITQLKQPREPLDFLNALFRAYGPTQETHHAPAVIDQETSTSTQEHVHQVRSSAETRATAPEPLHELINRENLDDPFVAEIHSVQTKHTEHVLPRVIPSNIKGSLDLRYEFPAPADRTPSAARASTSTENREHSDATAHGRMVPRFQGLNPTARSLFPAPGLTIANPYPTVPSFGISAPSVPETSARVPKSDGSTTNACSTVIDNGTVMLRFSDPDVLRKAQQHEIANGLHQQVPTPQNFKGPFFTASKPTATDPTASLSVPISEEEKLRNWYRDGHNPVRQREYALYLTSAVSASSSNRCPGSIESAADIVVNSEAKNTTPFIRLYEGLAEYVEEYRKGSGKSYFTRAWKVAPACQRDIGPNGNQSFFAGGGPEAYTSRHEQKASGKTSSRPL